MELLASPQHLADIHGEKATATIRRGIREINPGEEIIFKSNDEKSMLPNKAVITTRIVHTIGEHLTADDFGSAGLDQRSEEGWKQLREVYPEADLDDEFTVIYFHSA